MHVEEVRVVFVGASTLVSYVLQHDSGYYSGLAFVGMQGCDLELLVMPTMSVDV